MKSQEIEGTRHNTLSSFINRGSGQSTINLPSSFHMVFLWISYGWRDKITKTKVFNKNISEAGTDINNRNILLLNNDWVYKRWNGTKDEISITEISIMQLF
jgi:hypothetical protein